MTVQVPVAIEVLAPSKYHGRVNPGSLACPEVGASASRRLLGLADARQDWPGFETPFAYIDPREDWKNGRTAR